MCNLLSQDFSINGTVEDSKGTPIAFANIQLLSQQDSTLINGSSTDENGHFAILDVLRGLYYIKASYLENESELRFVEVNADMNLEPILVNSDAQVLKEVVVTSQKPKLERKVDRLVYNIENTALTDSDIWDVMKRTPSVVIINDKLTVKGSDAVGILINGRKVNLPQDDIINLLSGTSASGVEAIEVISNPPAKYGAEDGVLINILMKRNLVAGYNGAMYNKYVQGVLPKHTLGTDHYFKGKKIDLSVNYNFGHSRNVTQYTDVTNFIENNEIASTWSTEQEYIGRKQRHNISVYFDYDLSEKSRLSLSAITIWQPLIKSIFDTQTLIVGDTTLSSFDMFNNAKGSQINTSYYLDFIQELNNKGSEISINGHYTFYDNTKGQLLETDFYDTAGNFMGENNFLINSEQYINLYTLQADYLTPWGKSAKFETGLRYAGIASRNILVQEGFDRTMPGIAPTDVGNFKYDESIYAGYASLNAKWDKWKMRSGLRAEYTETLGKWDVSDQNRENNYFELFPSMSVQYTLNKNHDFNVYYNRRITRPRYTSISPFQVFLSNFSTFEGNPDLLPATRHYVAGGYTYKNGYTFELFYRNEKNGLRELVYQDNDTQFLRFISSNIDRNVSYGLDFLMNKDITNFWDSRITVSIFNKRNRFRDVGTNELIQNEQFSWYFRTNNSFTFLSDKSLMADLSFFYNAPYVFGNAKYDGYGALSLMFRKTLWNKKVSISLGMEDIFNQGNQFNSRNYLDQNSTSLRRAENRLFTLGFRYKFGNMKIRDNQKSKRVDERNRF